MHKIKKNDLVKIITGKDKDKTGKVLHVDSKTGKVLVEGCNMVTKHVKPGLLTPMAALFRRKPRWISPMLCWLLTERLPELDSR